MSVVNCKFVRADGSTRQVEVTFQPVLNSQVDGANLIVRSPVKKVTDSAGFTQVTLEQGDYSVVTVDGTSFNITVPDDTNTYNLTDLITSSVGWTMPSYGSIRFTNIQLSCPDDGNYVTVKVRKDGSNYTLELA